MSAAGDQLCDDRSHEEKIDIKTLLKLIVETQAKQAEFQAKQEESQQQIIEILRSTNSGGKLKEEITNDTDPVNDIDAHVAAQEDDNEQAAEVEVDSQVAIYVPGRSDLLYEALMDDDFEKFEEILRNNPEAIKDGIAYDSSTALHIATTWRRDIIFIKKIVDLMPPEILECKINNYGYTACHSAAMYGYAEAAVLMVNKNHNLTQMRDARGNTPLEIALEYVTTGQKDTVEYLYSVTRDEPPSPFLGQYGVRLLHKMINANFYDMALHLVKRFPKLVTQISFDNFMCGLELMVRRPFAFRSGAKLSRWQDCIYSLIQVDMTNRYEKNTPPEVKGTQTGEKHHSESSDCDKRDEGKLQDSLEVSRAKEVPNVSSAIEKGNLMWYLARVPHLKKLYNIKLMHEQATALLKQMLVEVRSTNNDSEALAFFENNPKIMKVAIKHGIIEVMVEVLEQFPYLIWNRLPEQMMIEMAIAERHENIVTLICNLGDIYEDKSDLVSKTDNYGNTILHYAAKLAPSAKLNSISGVALQLQREVQWFKGVESIMRESDMYKRNKKGDTAQDIFTDEHKDLLKKGEDWMKDTSGSCMIIGALIVTISFSAAFTVPGGNISDTNSLKNGTPVFLATPSFTVFAVADALALFSSITSVLMFLAVYTSRYSELDFLKSLPQKLIIGLTTLFISMAAILIAFCASLFIVIGDKFPGGVIPIALFGCVPVVLFAWLQLPLFYEMVVSTYWGGLFQEHRYIDPRVEKNDNKKESIGSRAKRFIT